MQHIPYFLLPTRQVIPLARGARYTPRRVVPNLSQHEFTCSALTTRWLRGAPGATPGTRPLAPPPDGRLPQSIATPLDRGFQFLHAQSSAPLRVTPLRGPLRGGTAGSVPTQHFGPFVPRRHAAMPPMDYASTAPAPEPPMVTH